MPLSVTHEPPEPAELAQLLDLVGWGINPVEVVARSVAAYPCTLCVRTEEGKLVGYLSAFSDEVMSTLLGELIVHPHFRRRRVATSLIRALEHRYPHAPIYIKALGESKLFYESCGFRRPKAELTVMFKRPAQI